MRGHTAAVLLGCIVLLGAVLRLYHLTTVPTELTYDEVDLYNSARSIATTGHDVDGKLLPFFYSNITRNPPAYAVGGYISTLVFGKTPLALRLPAVVFGLSTIVLLYGVTLCLTKRRDLALIAALLAATQPIFVQFSRIAWEPAAELPALLGGLYALLRAYRKAYDSQPEPAQLSFRLLALGAVLLALTCYTYMAGWFYALVLGGTLVAFNARRFGRDGAVKVAGAAAIWFAVSAPALWMCFFDPLTVSRAAKIATFAHGVSLESLRIFGANYLSHFRTSYLVRTGDPQAGLTWRYLNGFGAFALFVVPLAAGGLVAVAFYVREKALMLWVWAWLLIYPLGGALTNEGAPNAPRTLAGAPVFCILAAVGFAFFAEPIAGLRLRGRSIRYGWLCAALAVVCLGSTASFARFYFTDYVHRNSNAWDSGTAALFAALRADAAGYERACFSVRPASYPLQTYARYYLESVPLQAFDANDAACTLPKTLVVADREHPFKRPGFVPLEEISDVDGSPFATIFGDSRH